MAATREGRGKRHFLEENDISRLSLGGEAVPTVRLTAVSSCHGLMSVSLAQASPYLLVQKSAKKSQNIVTLPL